MPIPALQPKRKRSWQRRNIIARKKRKNFNFKLPKLIGFNFNGLNYFKLPKKKLLSLVVFFIIIFSIFCLAILAWLTHDLPDPNRLITRTVAQSTKIYDRTGQHILYEIFTEERRTLVELKNIPRDLVSATLVSEDRNFFQHQGFDLKAIFRAIVIDILRGGKVQGGSTLTQQFIKNSLLSPKKSYIRKVRELILAYQIESKFSKEEILQMYFNEIPYGSNAYGIEAASQIYFNKSARDLTLDEAALLAALPKAPTYYSPYGNNQEELIGRQHYILNGMAEEGYITYDQAETAKEIDTLEKTVARRENITAPHFVMYIKGLLTEKYGYRMVEQGGLKVITTLDWEKQKIAEAAIEEYAERNEKSFKATNASLVSIDVSTGQIVAMVGSRDFFDESIDGQVNVSLRLRQPGSSFKPIVYATAFEKGYTPDTILFDVETNFGPAGPDKDKYMPRNYDGEFRGPLTMRKALAGSLNVPSVKTLYLAGVDQVLNMAHRLGYTTLLDRSRYGLSLVLGGGEVKLLEHTAAFASLAREGKGLPINCILKIERPDNKVLEEANNEIFTPYEIMPSQVARLINGILSNNSARAFVFGTNNYLTLPDRPVAAKTGTTNDFRDAWTIGYTPSLATGVWVGNSRNEAMLEGADGSTVAAPIWNKYMREALSNMPAQNFNPPDPIETNKPILMGELPGEITLVIDKASGKLATDLTPESFKVEKTYQGYRPILFYLNKNNPLGPAPENPASDPQYDYWTEGIENWLKKQDPNLAEVPPTEYDDLHVPENQPSISIASPQDRDRINEQFIEMSVQASASRGIDRVVCSVDNIPLDTVYNLPYICHLNLAGLKTGNHYFQATAYDDIDNKKTAEIVLKTTRRFDDIITWLSPDNNQIIYQENFPFNLSILTPAKKISSIKFFVYNFSSHQTNLIGTIFNPENSGRLNLLWSGAEQGQYRLSIEVRDENNKILPSKKIEIEIK